MKDQLFEELLDSVKQGEAIFKDKKKTSGTFDIENPDVRTIRKSYGLSQNNFAKLLGISVSTLRNWEQGRRKPKGPAKVLLLVASKHPEAILDTIHNSR